jgi:hypothetical protein
LVAGAGFSKPWGHPLTSELFPLVKKLVPWLGPNAPKMIAPVLRAVERSGKFGHPLDLENFLTALRKAYAEDDLQWEKTYGITKDGGLWDPELIYRSLVQLLGLALAKTDPARDRAFRERVRSKGPPEPYSSFLQEFGPFDGVVTTNYDAVPESLFAAFPDYGFGSDGLLTIQAVKDDFFDMKENFNANIAKNPDLRRILNEDSLESIRMQPIKRVSATRGSEGDFPVMKIHGGVNLVYCPSCDGKLVSPEVHGSSYVRYVWGWLGCTGFASSFHCGPIAYGHAPPNMNPDRLQSMALVPIRQKEALPEARWLAPIVLRAGRMMKSASRVVVVGSSIRPADEALAALIQLASESRMAFIGDDESYDRLLKLAPRAEHVGRRL